MGPSGRIAPDDHFHVPRAPALVSAGEPMSVGRTPHNSCLEVGGGGGASGGRTAQPAAPGSTVSPHGGAPMMNTGVPIGTSGYSASDSEMCIRMHPCDAHDPIEESDGVPWMRMPGASRYRARVPSGLPGPGGISSGSPAAQQPGSPKQGLCQVGFSALLMTVHAPGGVSNPGAAVATP